MPGYSSAARSWLMFVTAACFISGTVGSEYVGCYPLTKRLGARLPVPKLDLGGCLSACLQHRSSPFVAYRNAQICYCLSTLEGLPRLQDAACPSKCWRDPPTTTRTCGGKTSVSVYATENSPELSRGLIIETEEVAYGPGDMLFANCSYNLPATLVFYLNGLPVATSQSSSDFVGPGPSSLHLSLRLLPFHLNTSHLTLTCSAVVIGLTDHIVTQVQLSVLDADTLSDKILVDNTTQHTRTTSSGSVVSWAAAAFVVTLLVLAAIFLTLLIGAWTCHRPGEKLKLCSCSALTSDNPQGVVDHHSK